MEEKELNLLELLKGCEGKKIFLPDEGYVTINAFGYEAIEVEDKDGRIYNLVGEETLRIRSTGFAYLYPTQESFEQNPLNAAKAWQEWKEARKPKRWEPQPGERFFFVNAAGMVSQDFCRTEEESNGVQLRRRAVGNEFRTGKAAESFAQIYREALAKFHEENENRNN